MPSSYVMGTLCHSQSPIPAFRDRYGDVGQSDGPGGDPEPSVIPLRLRTLVVR